jgi:hypothetical protein
MKCVRCKGDFTSQFILACVCDPCLEKNGKFTTAEKTKMNSWDKLEDFLEVYAKMSSGEWSWACNTQCKYVDLRVDMRDGGCIIKTRDGVRIGPDRLAWQYSKEKPNPPET